MIWSKMQIDGANSKINSMKKLENEIVNCTKCYLCNLRHNTVPGEGDVNSRMFIIGEGPGEQNDLYGRPFIGRGGAILDSILTDCQIDRNLIFLTNVIKCRMPHNADPKDVNINACKDYLIRQINCIQPKVLVVLGLVAAKTLLEDKKITIKSLENRCFSFNGIPVLVTFHPSSIRYSKTNRVHIFQTLKKAKELCE